MRERLSLFTSYRHSLHPEPPSLPLGQSWLWALRPTNLRLATPQTAVSYSVLGIHVMFDPSLYRRLIRWSA